MSQEQTQETTPELREAADHLLKAAYDYWRVLGAVAGSRAVLWLEDTAGRVVIFTRGEYRQHLMESIERRGLELHFTELPEKGVPNDPC